MSQSLFTPFTTPRLERKYLAEHNFLREDHYKRLSRNKNGVLRDLTIASANLYSTFDYGHILDIFTDAGNARSSDDFTAQSMAQRIAHTGALIIPYPDYTQGPNIGTRNWRRMRTDLVQSKYLSPLGKYSPPYRVLGFDHADTIDIYKGQLIKEVLSEDTSKTSQKQELIKQTAAKVFEAVQIDALKGSYKNPSIPMIVVEGEFKAMAILDAWMDNVKALIQDCANQPNPEAAVANLAKEKKLPPLFTCAGIGGVWNMVTKDKTNNDKKYVVRPEWQDNIALDNRELLICFDSDSKWLVGVGHAASSLAGACQPFKSVIKYITIPSPRGAKLGADDFIELHGPDAFLKLIGEAKPIAEGVAFIALQGAMRDGTSHIDYLINLKEMTRQHKDKRAEELGTPAMS
jgi:Domain of unknown function (DUF3854)